MANYLEVAYGAHVTLVDGLISDCARIVAERSEREGWFDVSTLKEPFRVEGKKTMGYELVEQLGWSYPEAVFYPTGGGVGLIGMWKAFEEMSSRLVPGQRPRMIAVQASGCAPVAPAGRKALLSPGCSNTLRPSRPARACPNRMATRSSSPSSANQVARSSIYPTTDPRLSARLVAQRGPAASALKEQPPPRAYYELLANGLLKREDRVVLFNSRLLGSKSPTPSPKPCT